MLLFSAAFLLPRNPRSIPLPSNFQCFDAELIRPDDGRSSFLTNLYAAFRRRTRRDIPFGVGGVRTLSTRFVPLLDLMTIISAAASKTALRSTLLCFSRVHSRTTVRRQARKGNNFYSLHTTYKPPRLPLPYRAPSRLTSTPKTIHTALTGLRGVCTCLDGGRCARRGNSSHVNTTLSMMNATDVHAFHLTVATYRARGQQPLRCSGIVPLMPTPSTLPQESTAQHTTLGPSSPIADHRQPSHTRMRARQRTQGQAIRGRRARAAMAGCVSRKWEAWDNGISSGNVHPALLRAPQPSRTSSHHLKRTFRTD
ncbi:hypothetical protein DFH06DRAFT_1359186 [Mycena polygramma]|nr:hypothetical protein DFH06DRAFT_1359186 [Mycena polygramma]